MSGIRELHTRWDGVAGAPYWTTLRATTVGTTSAQDLADAWIDFLNTIDIYYVNDLTANVLPEVTVIESTTGLLTGTETVTGAAIPGVSTGEMLPRTTQALLRFQTDTILVGRRLRGRIFLPGFNEGTNADNGAPDTAVAASVTSEISTLVTAMAGELVIYSRTHLSGGAVTSASMWSEWATMRSRRD